MASFFSNALQSSNTTLALVLGTRILAQNASIQSAFETIIPGFKLVHGLILRKFNFDITRLVSLGAATVALLKYDALRYMVARYLSQRYMKKSAPRFISAISANADGENESRPTDESYDSESGIRYFPKVGSHWFLFNMRPFMFEEYFETLSQGMTLDHTVNNITPRLGDPVLVVRCLGWSAKPLREFLARVQKWVKEDTEERAVTEVLTPSTYKDYLGYWRHKDVMSRPLDTVELDDSIKRPLIEDLGNFFSLSTKKYYREQGIPYRRGYLFHGPSGTGKTSLARALAGHFQVPLCVVGLSMEGMTGGVMTSLFDRLPESCIVVLEDIDSAGLKTREELKRLAVSTPTVQGSAEADALKGITLSDIFNVLNGTTAAEGRLVILTTNTPEVLDPALIRAGRIDRQVALLAISRESASSIFRRMYFALGHHGSDQKIANLAVSFASKLPEASITAAEVQGFLLEHRQRPEQALEMVEGWATALIKAKEDGKNIVNTPDSGTQSPVDVKTVELGKDAENKQASDEEPAVQEKVAAEGEGETPTEEVKGAGAE